jgi:hypothetical protein
VAKSQTQRTNEYRAKIKQERDALKAERDALRDEVADLRCQIAERTDMPEPSPLDKLSPESRAEFDKRRVVGRFAVMSDMEVLAAISDHALQHWAKKRLAADKVADEKAQYAEDVEWGMF